MALALPMADAIMDEPASSFEHNRLRDNVLDLDARLGPVVSGSTAHARLTTLESRTTDTATAPGGIGNQRLADRLGSGVGTGTNVLTGSASSQLTDARARLTTLEAASGGASGPICQLRQTVAQSGFTNGGFHAVTFNTEDIDSHNGHSTVTNPSRWTAPASWAGWYEMSGALVFDSVSTTGGRLAVWRKNGVDIPAGYGPTFPGSVGQGAIARPMLIFLDVGDYVELYGRWAGGGTVPLDASTGNQAHMMLRWVRA